MIATKSISFDDIKDQLKNIVITTILYELKGKKYSNTECEIYSQRIPNFILKEITEQCKNFKYLINCMISKKSKRKVHISSSWHWNSATDGTLVECWENENLYCVVTVFAVAR